jgi:hypothetical protein
LLSRDRHDPAPPDFACDHHSGDRPRHRDLVSGRARAGGRAAAEHLNEIHFLPELLAGVAFDL